MLDITTLLLPELRPPTGAARTVFSQPQQSSDLPIHPSRMQNFQSTAPQRSRPDNYVDPSFRPRPKDITRARRLLLKSITPAPPRPTKLTTLEKQARRKAKREKRNGPVIEFIRTPIIPTRELIDDALAYFLDGVTNEGQVLMGMVNKLKADVRSGGRLIKLNDEIYSRLGLRREGVAEDGTGGRIVVEVLPEKKKKKIITTIGRRKDDHDVQYVQDVPESDEDEEEEDD